MEIRFHKKIKMDSSVMLAGWPGMGNVAVDTVNYLRRKLGARFFAEINTGNTYTPEGVLVNKGEISFPEPPSTLLHYRKHPPVTILEGAAQFHGHEAAALSKKILEAAKQVNTEAIITSAAFPVAMNHTDQPEVYFASNNRSLSMDFKKIGLKPLNTGQIAGLNGMLLGFAKSAGIDGACLLATIPRYAIGIQNPRAVIEILDILSHLLDEEIDLREIEEYAEEMDKKLDEAEAGLKDAPAHQLEDGNDGGTNKVPGKIIKKIEKLFEEAKTSRQKAVKLKEELDRWDIYPAYEDRFLDLFRKSH